MTGKWRTYQDRMTVDIPEGEVDGLKVSRFEVKSTDLWNLKQELRYGRGTAAGWYTSLVDHAAKDPDGNPVFWMSDTDAEKADHVMAVARIQMGKAERVLINGLGLGMVLAAALSYPHVKRVDVVEYDERVIKLVGPHYLKDPRVRIIHADAYEQMGRWHKNDRWDVVWSDIWPSIDMDNLPEMDRLHAFYSKRADWHGSWARDVCLKLKAETDQLAAMVRAMALTPGDPLDDARQYASLKDLLGNDDQAAGITAALFRGGVQSVADLQALALSDLVELPLPAEDLARIESKIPKGYEG